MKSFISIMMIVTVALSMFSFSLITAVPVASALDLTTDMEKLATSFGEDVDAGDTLPARIGALINVVLSILGVILVVIIVYAGFLWMTAGGDTEGVKKAKDWIKNAVIGLVLVLSAYAIASFVITKLLDATTGGY